MSVCIPTYNGARYLKAALESASSQTFADIEILCVDDGSTDETAAIVRAHQTRDPRTVLVQNPQNLGLVDNWNRSLELARGEWIKFLFQDDTLHPECIERMLAATKVGDKMVVCGREYVFEMAEEDIDPFYRKTPKITEMETEAHLTADEAAGLLCKHFSINIVGEPICLLFHKDVPATYGPFDNRLRQLCDHEYWVRVACNTGLVIIREQLARFTVHSASTSAKNAQTSVNVSAIDLTIMLDKVARERHFRRARRALGFRISALLHWNLFLLSQQNAREVDRGFARFLASRPSMAWRYEFVKSAFVSKGIKAVARRFGKWR